MAFMQIIEFHTTDIDTVRRIGEERRRATKVSYRASRTPGR